jgi:hypothetical protein
MKMTVLAILLFLIAPKFAEAKEPPSLFPIEQNGRCGYIDKTGKVVIEPLYYECEKFSEGLAPVRYGSEKWGWIDRTGNFVIQPMCFEPDSFSEGLAVCQGLAEFYINRTGKIVIIGKGLDNPIQIARPFSEGLALITQGFGSD